jgi:hypothetical protein
MRIRLVSVFRSILLCCLVAALPVFSQTQNQPPQRPNPGSGSRPTPPPGQRPGQGNRPQPSRPNPGQRPPNPPRPNPGPRPNPPRPNPPRPNPGGGQRPPQRPRPPARPPHRPPNWGRPPANRPSYNFRPTDRDYLRRYYQHRFGYINRARRPVFTVGGYFPYGDIGYLTPLPANIYGYLPPPPPGYQMGYFDGYVVVYDPLTYFIANVIDLLQ